MQSVDSVDGGNVHIVGNRIYVHISACEKLSFSLDIHFWLQLLRGHAHQHGWEDGGFHCFLIFCHISIIIERVCCLVQSNLPCSSSVILTRGGHMYGSDKCGSSPLATSLARHCHLRATIPYHYYFFYKGTPRQSNFVGARSRLHTTTLLGFLGIPKGG